MEDEERRANGRARASGAGRLAAVSVALALLSCYGTTALIGLLSLVGVSLALNARAWAATIVLLAGLAVAGLLFRLRRHRRAGPFITALPGFGLIAWVMLRSYDPRLEAAGFAILLGAVLWDHRSVISVRARRPRGSPASIACSRGGSSRHRRADR
jgi:hypothetical protein